MSANVGIFCLYFGNRYRLSDVHETSLGVLSFSYPPVKTWISLVALHDYVARLHFPSMDSLHKKRSGFRLPCISRMTWSAPMSCIFHTSLGAVFGLAAPCHIISRQTLSTFSHIHWDKKSGYDV